MKICTSIAVKPSRRENRAAKTIWPSALLACAIAAGFCTAVLHRSGNNAAQLVTVPGWDDLVLCADTTSIDGTKELELREDQHAVLRLKKDEGDQTIEGQWSFNELTKRYSVSVDGTTTTYSIVSLSSVPSCMLIAGDISAADLHASWFSLPPDDYDPREH